MAKEDQMANEFYPHGGSIMEEARRIVDVQKLSVVPSAGDTGNPGPAAGAPGAGRGAELFQLLRTPRQFLDAVQEACDDASRLMDVRTHWAQMRALDLLEDALRMERVANLMLRHGWGLDGREVK